MHRLLAVLLALSVSAAAQEPPQTPPGGVVRPAPGTPDAAKPQDRPAPGTSAATGRTYPEVVAPPRVGISLMQTRLTLQEAIQMALANNLEIEIEKTNIDNAQQNVLAARGFFDPNFRWVPGYQLTNTPTGSVLQGASGKLTDRNFVNNFAFRWPLPNNGTAVGLTFDNGRSTTTNPFTSFNPTYLSRLAVGFTQPMLRGRTVDPQRAELRIRQKQVDVSQLDFETRVIDVITRVQTAYWNLAAARADTDVNRDVAAQAREQLAINQRLVKAGTLAPVELSAAEAELERRLDSWYASLQVVTQVENELKTLLARNRDAEIWRDEIIPSETDRLPEPSVDDLRAAVTTALQKRPELRNVGVQQQINDVRKELADNLRKPQVDIVAQYSLSGLGGTIFAGNNPFTASQAATSARINELSELAGLDPLPPSGFGPPPDFLVGGYGTALGNLFGGRYQSFQAGIAFDLNIRNRTANANYAQTVIGERRLRLEQTRLSQLIEAQVRNALQGIESAKQRISAGQAGVRAAREKLESEQRLYQTGESTNFLVLTRQNELAESRRRLILALLSYNRNIAELQQAVGTTLAENRVTLR